MDLDKTEKENDVILSRYTLPFKVSVENTVSDQSYTIQSRETKVNYRDY